MPVETGPSSLGVVRRHERSGTNGLPTAAVPPGPRQQARPASSMRLWGSVLLAGLVLSVVLLAGCGRPGTAVTTPFATTRPVLQHGPVYEVKAQPVNGLGPVLTDGQGITLYLYANDRQGAPSKCYGICAVQWPPLVLPQGVSAPVAGVGIEPRLLGTAPRTDGTTQITYNGWPLYLWPPDRSPGMATGQGLTNAGGRWYVLTPAGDAIVPP